MFPSSFWMISDSLSKSNITDDILSVSITLTQMITVGKINLSKKALSDKLFKNYQ